MIRRDGLGLVFLSSEQQPSSYRGYGAIRRVVIRARRRCRHGEYQGGNASSESSISFTVGTTLSVSPVDATDDD